MIPDSVSERPVYLTPAGIKHGLLAWFFTGQQVVLSRAGHTRIIYTNTIDEPERGRGGDREREKQR